VTCFLLWTMEGMSLLTTLCSMWKEKDMTPLLHFFIWSFLLANCEEIFLAAVKEISGHVWRCWRVWSQWQRTVPTPEISNQLPRTLWGPKFYNCGDEFCQHIEGTSKQIIPLLSLRWDHSKYLNYSLEKDEQNKQLTYVLSYSCTQRGGSHCCFTPLQCWTLSLLVGVTFSRPKGPAYFVCVFFTSTNKNN
jgi:hypothetical protein